MTLSAPCLSSHVVAPSAVIGCGRPSRPPVDVTSPFLVSVPDPVPYTLLFLACSRKALVLFPSTLSVSLLRFFFFSATMASLPFWSDWSSPSTAAVATTAALATATVFIVAREVLWPKWAKILRSPLKTSVARMTPAEIKTMVYRPDHFPGARDVETPVRTSLPLLARIDG